MGTFGLVQSGRCVRVGRCEGRVYGGRYGEPIAVGQVIPPLVETFGGIYGKEMEEMDPEREGEIGELIRELEEEAIAAGEWTKELLVNAT